MIQASAVLEKTDLDVEPVFEKKLQELLEECRAHLPAVEEDLIRRAFRLSYWAHRNDWRASGERYISHPLEVATLTAREVSFDDTSVAAALLHDVVEDTDLSLDFIRAEFGTDMAALVDGLTKITGVFESRELSQAENVRKLMLSMATDVRVILVKFADRLHNMRTIEALPKPKRLKIATETRDLFAPLAHRFGLFKIKSELEDLCLKIIEPQRYYDIVKDLRATKEERQDYIASFIAPLREHLEEHGFDFEIYGRPKHIASIDRKMRRQEKPLEEIYDLFAIRIVLQSEGRQGKEDCWRVYSVVTDLYRPMPERFRDFISVPKSNGYQSLHTTVVGPEGRKVEVQIRTQEMHEIAERGVAAHWKYKEGEDGDQEMDQFLDWVRDLLDNPEANEATEFVKEFRLNLYDEEIYVFTPQGDLMTLPSGATPVDFAFKVHTEVGMQCIGAKVGGKMVPLSQELKSGDQVEIITSQKQSPSEDWMNFVVTHKARSRVRHWVNRERREAAELGREAWEKKARRAGVEISDQDLQEAAHELKFPDLQQMFYEIGSGLFEPQEMIDHLKQETPSEAFSNEDDAESLRLRYEQFLDDAQDTGQPALKVDGELHTDLATKYANCCNPIPGDEVFGFISKTGTINIHRTGCRNASNLLTNQPDRIVPVEWSRQKDVQFVAPLRVTGKARKGLVRDLTTTLSNTLDTDIRSITVDTDDGIFEGTVVIYVTGLDHLRRVIDRLRRVDDVHGVQRFEE
jgi:GTP pyrophosphokinase/guanosine-3',5'-bis(diphosphate) 3'-pyrophosphohydrolase